MACHSLLRHISDNRCIIQVIHLQDRRIDDVGRRCRYLAKLEKSLSLSVSVVSNTILGRFYKPNAHQRGLGVGLTRDRASELDADCTHPEYKVTLTSFACCFSIWSYFSSPVQCPVAMSSCPSQAAAIWLCLTESVTDSGCICSGP
jgi:hypothetical protein